MEVLNQANKSTSNEGSKQARNKVEFLKRQKGKAFGFKIKPKENLVLNLTDFKMILYNYNLPHMKK